VAYVYWVSTRLSYGVKFGVIDEQGGLPRSWCLIYPHGPQNRVKSEWGTFPVDSKTHMWLVAIAMVTASRETEALNQNAAFTESNLDLSYVVVSEVRRFCVFASSY